MFPVLQIVTISVLFFTTVSEHLTTLFMLFICFLKQSIKLFFVVIGICYNLPAGNISITLTLSAGYNAYHHVGYATAASRLYVEEIGQPTWSGGLLELFS